MSTVKALRPKDVAQAKQQSMPDVVLEAFNELITENFNGSRATVLQKDAIARIVAKGHSREEIFKKGWLDVEDIYRKQGWKVVYDKPGYNESYEASFAFSKK